MALRVPQVTIEVATQPTTANIRVAQVTLETAILPLPLSPWCGNPPSALIGQPYSFTLPFPGGYAPYTWAITSGTLPPGLSLNPSTGAITGTPTGEGFTCQEIIHFDSNTHNDQGAAINNYWESGEVRGPGDLSSMLIRIGGMILWVKGNGPAIIFVWSPDHQNAVEPPLLQTQGVVALLSPNPGFSYMASFDLVAENFTVQFGTNAVDAWCQISMIQPLWKDDLYNR